MSEPQVATDGPVLAVSGASRPERAALLAAAARRLAGRGLDVAVLEADAPEPWPTRVAAARSAHDLVLVSTDTWLPLPWVWLASDGDPQPPAGPSRPCAVLSPGPHRLQMLVGFLAGWLPTAWRAIPVFGGLLVGGRSRRMGTPKPLLPFRGATLAEHVATVLAAHTREVVLLGDGPIPDALANCPRLADAPGVRGPLAGILAALRREPGACWLVAACDLPLATPAAAAWLLRHRRPGVRAVLPRTGGGVEPLFAVYEPAAASALEQLAAEGTAAPHRLAEVAPVATPSPPRRLARCWFNLNAPEDLAALGKLGAGRRKTRG